MNLFFTLYFFIFLFMDVSLCGMNVGRQIEHHDVPYVEVFSVCTRKEKWFRELICSYDKKAQKYKGKEIILGKLPRDLRNAEAALAFSMLKREFEWHSSN